jgi:hypothetical protein
VIRTIITNRNPDDLDRMCKRLVFVGLTAAFVYGFFLSKVSDDTFTNVVLIVIGFYYGRSTSPATNGDKAILPPGSKVTTPATTTTVVSETTPEVKP